MSAQEFSSPGEHMASLGSIGSSGISSNGIIYSRGSRSDDVSFNPPIYFGSINKSYNNADFVRSARDFSDDFNNYYMRYNNDMFNTAMEYDKFMSNTAIQRQVADLKAAGLNPILATRLGGAVYKGVNAPYLSIQPSSAFNSLLDYDATIDTNRLTNETNRDIAYLNNETDKFISQYNKVMDRLINHDDYLFGRDLIDLQHECNVLLDSVKKFNQKDLMSFGFRGEKDVNDFQNELNKNYKHFAASVDLSADKEISDYKYSTQTNEGLYRWLDLTSSIFAGLSSQGHYTVYR